MEEAIKQLKELAANEANLDVKQGYQKSVIVLLNIMSEQLTNEINNHINQN